MKTFISFSNKTKSNILLPIIVTLLIIIPTLNVQADFLQTNLQKNNKSVIENTESYNSIWKIITNNGFNKDTNIGTRGMAVYKDELYIGTQNVKFPKLFPELFKDLSKFIPNLLPRFLNRNLLFKIIYFLKHLLPNQNMRSFVHLAMGASEGCEIWKYNYMQDTLTQIVGDSSDSKMKSGFNSNFNSLAATIYEYKGKLYVGTCTTPIGDTQDPNRLGGEIWRYDGERWEQIVGNNASFVDGGFGNSDNIGIFQFKEFNGYLYAGTINFDFSLNGGVEIWRSEDGLRWEQVVDDGFKSFMTNDDIDEGVTNTYVWSMEVFQDQLYVGTFNSCYRLGSSKGMGCQLWRTIEGKKWEKMQLPNGDGFGEPENYGIRTMVVYNNELYVGTATNLLHDKGFEIWKFDGVKWTPVIGDDVPGVKPTDVKYNGFGNRLNKYAWSMIVTSDNILWVGTVNCRLVNLLEPETLGGEIWCYNGVEWFPIVKDEIGEISSGFGNIKNEGIRSMIEYPQKSGNVVAGTFKFTSTRLLIPLEGCEIWMRIK